MPHRTRRIDPAAAAAGQDTDALAEATLHTRLAYAGDLLRVYRDIVRCPDGHVTYREFIHHPGAVVVIPMLDDDHVLLERQFRYPLGRTFIEFPAGKIDPGEALLACAQRELLEETGYTARQWARAGVLHPVISYSTEFIDVWFARELTQGERKLDAGEFLDVFTDRPA